MFGCDKRETWTGLVQQGLLIRRLMRQCLDGDIAA